MLIKSLCCRECEGGQDGRRGEQPGSVQTSLCAIQQSGRDQHLHLRHRQLPLHTDTHGLHRSVGPIYNFNLRPQIVHIHIFTPVLPLRTECYIKHSLERLIELDSADLSKHSRGLLPVTCYMDQLIIFFTKIIENTVNTCSASVQQSGEVQHCPDGGGGGRPQPR